MVEELKVAITQLSQEDWMLFTAWFEEHRADRWDRCIEADIRAGKLDALGVRADADFEAGRCTRI